MKSLTLLALLSAGALTACGGSSSDATVTQLLGLRTEAFDEISAIDLANDYLTSAPAQTSASMNGMFGVFADSMDDTTVYGEMSMDADFVANTVSGTMNNMVEVDDLTDEAVGDVNGSLTYAGTIDFANAATTPVIFSNVTGTLSNAETGTIAVDFDMTGDFYGFSNGLGAYGELSGTVTTTDGTEGLNGEFAVWE